MSIHVSPEAVIRYLMMVRATHLFFAFCSADGVFTLRTDPSHNYNKLNTNSSLITPNVMESRKAGLQLESVLINAIKDDNYTFSPPDYKLETTQLPISDQKKAEQDLQSFLSNMLYQIGRAHV